MLKSRDRIAQKDLKRLEIHPFFGVGGHVCEIFVENGHQAARIATLGAMGRAKSQVIISSFGVERIWVGGHAALKFG